MFNCSLDECWCWLVLVAYETERSCFPFLGRFAATLASEGLDWTCSHSVGNFSGSLKVSCGNKSSMETQRRQSYLENELFSDAFQLLDFNRVLIGPKYLI